ncbi:MAG TPA: hypothetical protein VLA92_04685 [Candidatus Saccharimonadales bacterium]|nr:hypothetical protein [Candidatus Saccharimonadales bacterium]
MSTQQAIWYIDARPATSTDQISLDLTRHLPQRSTTGTAVVVTDSPTSMLPVVRKRWMRIIREFERHRSSTLDRSKRQGLQHEIDRMKSLNFTSKVDHPFADVMFITPAQTVCELPRHSTLYVVSKLTPQQLLSVTEYAQDRSVVVVYGEWKEYVRAIQGKLPNYGEGAYSQFKVE